MPSLAILTSEMIKSLKNKDLIMTQSLSNMPNVLFFLGVNCCYWVSLIQIMQLSWYLTWACKWRVGFNCTWSTQSNAAWDSVELLDPFHQHAFYFQQHKTLSVSCQIMTTLLTAVSIQALGWQHTRKNLLWGELSIQLTDRTQLDEVLRW